MSDEKILHYKKVFDTYSLVTYGDTINIDHTRNKSKYGVFRGKTPKNGYWVQKERINISEEDFVKNYSNKTVSVSSNRITLVIEEYDNKLALKVYLNFKQRNVGSQYFRVMKDMEYVTYNLKTKNLYNGVRQSKKKKVFNKKVRVNQFDSHPYTSLKLAIRRHVRDITDSSMSSMGDVISTEVMDVYLKLLEKKTGIYIDTKVNNLEGEMYRFYLTHNGIKYPDTYSEFASMRLPKRKLKRYKNVVTTVMKIFNLKGKHVKKILNQQKDFDLYTIVNLYNMLGIDYFNKLNKNVLVSNQNPSIISVSDRLFIKKYQPLSNSDKSKIVNVLNENIRYSLVCEHLKMIDKLKTVYSHDFKMRFTDSQSFDNEHYELSNLLSSYSKGDVTRFYGEGIKEYIETPIVSVDGIEYHPKLLLTTSDYNMESQIQHNCVRTYIEKPNCLIVSLRQGGEDSDERGTIEYRFRRKEMVRVQTLGKYNKTLSPRYDIPLEILDGVISNLYKDGKILLPKMKKEYKNGKIIERFSYFQNELSDGIVNNIYPVWDNSEDVRDENIFDLDLFF
jgi:hypothetical protein